MVYVEAASFGLPAIATDMPGVDEAVINDETGLLVPDGDIKALAAAMEKLAYDHKLCRVLGKQAQVRAKQFLPSEVFLPFKKWLYGR